MTARAAGLPGGRLLRLAAAGVLLELRLLSACLVEFALGPSGRTHRSARASSSTAARASAAASMRASSAACSRSRRASSASAAWTRACMASRSSSRSRVASAQRLVEHPGRFLVCPVRAFSPRRVRACLRRGGPLVGGPGGFLVLGRLLACLVTLCLGGADAGPRPRRGPG